MLEVLDFCTEELWASVYIYNTQVIVTTIVRFVMSKDELIRIANVMHVMIIGTLDMNI